MAKAKVEIIKCDECDKMCKGNAGLSAHKRQAHGDGQKQVRRAPEIPSIEQIEEVKNLWDTNTEREIAAQVNLREDTVRKVGYYMRRAMWVGEEKAKRSVGFCPKKNIKDRVQCVVANQGYVLPK